MNRAELNNTTFRINGYFSSYPGVPYVKRFEAAKEELIKNFQKDIANAEAMTLDEYEASKAKGFNV